MASKPIASPLRMLHCCIVSDGAVAFVVTTLERARDLRQRPVVVLGSGSGQAGYWTGFLAGGGASQGYSLTRTLAKDAGDQAFGRAGVARDDIDCVMLSDSFAIGPLLLLEEFGFCAKGDAGSFVGEGGERLMVGGELPCNTHGGALSCNHAGTNFQNYTEAVLQLQGRCGDRQVQGAELVLANGSAGILSTHYAHILAPG